MTNSSEKIRTKNPIHLNDIKEIEALDGIFRKTLAFNPEAMLCHFKMLKGSKIPLHDHTNAQVGYVISGKVKFLTEGSDFIVSTGNSYIFDPSEKHGAEILEDAIVLEVFTPVRPEYKPID